MKPLRDLQPKPVDNQYPKFSSCEKEQLIGEWTVMFKGYEMSKISFEVLPDILPNEESHFVECEVAYVLDPTSPGTMEPSEKFPGSEHAYNLKKGPLKQVNNDR